MNTTANYKEELLEQGWFVARGVLQPDDIRQAIERIRQIADNISPFEHLPNIVPSRLQLNDDPLYRFEWLDSIALFDQELWRTVAANPRLLAIAREIVGDEVFPTNGAGFSEATWVHRERSVAPRRLAI